MPYSYYGTYCKDSQRWIDRVATAKAGIKIRSMAEHQAAQRAMEQEALPDHHNILDK